MASADSRFCKDCAISFPASISFCTKCGKPLVQSATTATPELEKTANSAAKGDSPATLESTTAPADAPLGPLGSLIQDIHRTEDSYPWNAIGFAGVWVYLTLTYFL